MVHVRVSTSDHGGLRGCLCERVEGQAMAMMADCAPRRPSPGGAAKGPPEMLIRPCWGMLLVVVVG